MPCLRSQRNAAQRAAKSPPAARQPSCQPSEQQEEAENDASTGSDANSHDIDDSHTTRLAEISRQNARGSRQTWDFEMCQAFILGCMKHRPWAAKHGNKAASWEAIKGDILSVVPGVHVVANQLSVKMKALLAKHVVSLSGEFPVRVRVVLTLLTGE